MKKTLSFTLLACVTMFSTAFAETSNLLENGGFEAVGSDGAPAGWVFNRQGEGSRASEATLDPEEKCDGESALKISNTSPEAFCSVGKTVEVKTDQNYEISFLAKVTDLEGDGAGARLFITNGDDSTEVIHGDVKSPDWTRISATFNSGTNSSIIVRCYLHKVIGTVWFDDVQLKEVP